MFPYVLFKSGFHVMEAGNGRYYESAGTGGRTYGNRLLPLFFIAWRFERAGSGNFELHRSSGCLRYVGIRNGRGHGTDAGGGGVMILGFTLYNELGGENTVTSAAKDWL